jgi:hypothetical protein
VATLKQALHRLAHAENWVIRGRLPELVKSFFRQPEHQYAED